MKPYVSNSSVNCVMYQKYYVIAIIYIQISQMF
jgi:hypothetical protein